jgi:cobalt-zinc-cadmium efflux system protein
MIVEFVGGFLTGSLALVSDAGHMLSDAASLFLSFMAIWIAKKPATTTKTYGYKRIEILVALLNGVTLIGISLYIFIEAYHRFFNPVSISSFGMLLVSILGLLINILVAFLLTRGNTHDNLNIRSALYHVFSDILGSLSAIAAAILIYFFGWYAADSIASVLVALIVLYSGWNIIRESIHILMEGVPEHLNIQEIKASILCLNEVCDVHDLHVWTVTSGFPALSCHVVIQEGVHTQRILDKINHMIHEKYDIEHTTIQLESGHCHNHQLCTPK